MSQHRKAVATPTLFFKLGGSSKNSILEQSRLIQNIGSKHRMLDFKTSSSEEENDELWSARRNGFWSTFEYGKRSYLIPTMFKDGDGYSSTCVPTI